jgi:hypothetical protein
MQTTAQVPEDLSSFSNVNRVALRLEKSFVTVAAQLAAYSGRELGALVNNAISAYVWLVLYVDVDAAQCLHDINFEGRQGDHCSSTFVTQ